VGIRTRRSAGGLSASRIASLFEDLRTCFALSDRGRVLIFDQRGPENRLGLAASLCALRFMGFVPDDIASIPDEALAFVAARSTPRRTSC
jgi:Domain of unknown function (DUF4158)